MTKQALIVAAHGSHRNPDSAVPALDHAEAIRERGYFDQVRTAFWKDEPSFRAAVRTVDADRAYVVPLFVSEGYFVNGVLPREFELGIEDVRGEPTAPELVYADPIGTHPAMTDVIAARARRQLDGVPEADAALAVVGHGTDRNPNSAQAVYDHVDALEAATDFAEVGALFMDESPYVEDVLDHFEAEEIAVVPLFVADGFHTRDEIPELLGLADEPRSGYPVPGDVGGRRIWYASAVGTDPRVPEVILERAADAGADLGGDAGRDEPVRPDAAEAFLSWIDRNRAGDGHARREWGELLVVADGDGYELRHRADHGADREALTERDFETFGRFVRTDDGGRFRPFAGEQSVPTGWVLSGLTEVELLNVLASVYPAGIETWVDDPDPIPFESTAARQTGIYANVGDLSDEQIRSLANVVCGNCAKRCTWNEDGGGTPSTDAHTDETTADGGADETAAADGGADKRQPSTWGSGHPPCREPCSFLVAAAREVLESGTDEQIADHPDTDVPPGDLTDPENRYRVRYRQVRTFASD